MILSGTQNARPGSVVAAVPYQAQGDASQGRRPGSRSGALRPHAAIFHRPSGVRLGTARSSSPSAVSSALTRLPAEAYPQIAPPQVSVTATYPGASAATVETHGDADHRAAAHRPRPPAVLHLAVRLRRLGRHHPHVRERHQRGHRPPVQTQNRVTLRHAAPAGGSESAGHPHRQGERGIPAAASACVQLPAAERG